MSEENRGPDDFEAFKRTALKAAKDAARQAAVEQFSDLLEEAGFKTAAELKAFVKDTKKGLVTAEVPIVTPIEGIKMTDVPDPTKVATEKLASEAKVKESVKVMAMLIAAGVKDDDLDWAVSRFEAKKADLPPSGVATFGVDAFVSELKTAQPTMFVVPDATPVVPVVPIVDGVVPHTGTPPTSGNSNTPPPAPPPAGYNAKGKTPAENDARLRVLGINV